ncbi:hypothetical protein BD779DRAFT_1470796 [Infundibulicybe gibba]|nr:hypothetical protein BD779DRAFT_1470796 [Infundibulicybe gibba]
MGDIWKAVGQECVHITSVEAPADGSLLNYLSVADGLWCFGTHNIDIIFQCTKLVELSVTVRTPLNTVAEASVANTVRYQIYINCGYSPFVMRDIGVRGIAGR